MANDGSNIAKELQATPKIEIGDIPNFIPTENGDQNESLEAPKYQNGTENNELVCKPEPENEPISMDSIPETASSELEIGSVVLTSIPFSKIEGVSTSDPPSMASAALSSSNTNIALIQKIAPKSLSKAATPALTSTSKSCRRKNTSGKKTFIYNDCFPVELKPEGHLISKSLWYFQFFQKTNERKNLTTKRHFEINRPL